MRVTRIRADDPAGNPLLDYAYRYDAADNILEKATEHGVYRYAYDALDRLTKTDNPSLPDRSFAYDDAGNRLLDGQSSSPWTYNATNELLSKNGIKMSYDANGSLVETSQPDAATRLRYDLANRLHEVRDEGDAPIVRYRYDPFGRRLWKETNGERTYFLYGSEGLLGEMDAVGMVSRAYGWKPGGKRGTPPLFVRTSAQTYFYLADITGAPQKAIDATGKLAWAARYTAFGEATIEHASVVNNLRLPGQYYDAESNFNYNRFRYYLPGMGRYLGSDPLRSPGSTNTFVYANSNPLRYIDPLGLRSDCVATARSAS